MKQSLYRANLAIFVYIFILLPISVFGQQLICPQNSGTGTVAPPGSTAFSTSWKDNLPTGQKIIPVVVHLLGVANGLSNAQVQTALNLLNSDFNSANLDWDIEFRLAKFDPDGRCTDGITHLSTVKWPNKSYLNI